MTRLIWSLLLVLSMGVNAHVHPKDSKQSLLAKCQTSPQLVSVDCGRAPSIQFYRGLAYVVFSQQGHVYFTTTHDFGNTYSSPVKVNVASETIYDDGENRPKILIVNEQTILVSWSRKIEGRYAGDVRFARSVDGGKHFSEAITINQDSQPISHRFEVMALDKNNRLTIVWIDKRDGSLAKEQEKDYRGASLYMRYSDDLGESFSQDQKLVDHSCECCRISIAKDAKGELALLWRHVFEGQIRDHALAYLPATSSILDPLRATYDNWHLEGCPHQGPDFIFDQRNTAHMVWFTQGQPAGLIYGQFDFASNTAYKQHLIDDSAGASRPQIMVLGDAVYVVWKRFNGQSMDLLLKCSFDAGTSWETEHVIATTSADSDHPDLFMLDGTIRATWLTQTEGLRWLSIP